MSRAGITDEVQARVRPLLAAPELEGHSFPCPHCGAGSGAATSKRDPLFRRHIFSTGRLCAHCGIAIRTPKDSSATEIGRASCRERVCMLV